MPIHTPNRLTNTDSLANESNDVDTASTMPTTKHASINRTKFLVENAFLCPRNRYATPRRMMARGNTMLLAMVGSERRLMSSAPTRVSRENCQKRNGWRIIWEVNPIMQIARSWPVASFLGKGSIFSRVFAICDNLLPCMDRSSGNDPRAPVPAMPGTRFRLPGRQAPCLLPSEAPYNPPLLQQHQPM